MSTYFGKVSTLGLDFFSTMTAFNSQEVQDALALIDQQAALIDVMTLSIEQGQPLDTAGLVALAANIQQHVHDADSIVRRLNRFAHSMDQPVLIVHARDILQSMINLTIRLARMKEVTFILATGEEVQLTTPLLGLQNLLWICLKNLLEETKGGDEVSLGARLVGTDVVFFIKVEAGQPLIAIEKMIGREALPLVLLLKVEIKVDASKNQLLLQLPRKFIE